MSGGTGGCGWIAAFFKAPGVRVTVLVIEILLDPVYKTRILAPLCKRTHQGNLDPGLGNGMCPPSKEKGSASEIENGKKLTNGSEGFKVTAPSGKPTWEGFGVGNVGPHL